MISALNLFIFAGLFSPGPNVILLLSSGSRFGLRATLPHLFGVVVGVGIIGFLTGLGVGQLLKTVPTFQFVLLAISVAWILFMAWNLWNSHQANESKLEKPMSFQAAVLFQWVNPKIWAIAIAAIAFLEGQTPLAQGLQIGAALSCINLFVCFFWTTFGHLLSQAINEGPLRTAFNRFMAILLALSSMLLVVK